MTSNRTERHVLIPIDQILRIELHQYKASLVDNLLKFAGNKSIIIASGIQHQRATHSEYTILLSDFCTSETES